jgi:hypothetical protein
MSGSHKKIRGKSDSGDLYKHILNLLKPHVEKSAQSTFENTKAKRNRAFSLASRKSTHGDEKFSKYVSAGILYDMFKMYKEETVFNFQDLVKQNNVILVIKLRN